MRVVVVGASGLIGRRVAEALEARGDEVRRVTRAGEGGAVRWRGPPEPVPGDLLDGAVAVVNLAGAPLAGRRWTARYKAEIRRSRVALTDALAQALPSDWQGALVNASAVGYYGARGEELDETSAPGDDYLAHLCVDWEAAARRAEPAAARVVLLRSGLVLADEGPLLPRLATLARSMLGGSLGDGRQWFPWIHVDDEVALVLWALDRPEVRGPVNLTSPGVVRQRDFAAALRAVVGRSVGLPAPALGLRLALGEAAAAALSGQRPAPRVALDGGYEFRFPALEPALRDLLDR